MTYTPELNQRHSRTLRRIAWALGMPMTTVLEAVFDYVGEIIDGKRICEACRDQSHCKDCVFYAEQ